MNSSFKSSNDSSSSSSDSSSSYRDSSPNSADSTSSSSEETKKVSDIQGPKVAVAPLEIHDETDLVISDIQGPKVAVASLEIHDETDLVSDIQGPKVAVAPLEIHDETDLVSDIQEPKVAVAPLEIHDETDLAKRPRKRATQAAGATDETDQQRGPRKILSENRNPGGFHGKYNWHNWNEVVDLAAPSLDGPLYKAITHRELDHLVGWATHVTSQQYDGKIELGCSKNPLLDLPGSPLPPSILHFIHHSMTQETRGRRNITHLYETLDQSALVSLGICIEEIFTASLLPLATAHVQCCRKKSKLNEEAGWLLPPEECILELARGNNDFDVQCCLPTAKPPTYTVLSAKHEVEAEKTDDESITSVTRKAETEKANRLQALLTWAEAHLITHDFMVEREDIFRWFIGKANDIAPE